MLWVIIKVFSPVEKLMVRWEIGPKTTRIYIKYVDVCTETEYEGYL